jgi:hypothetical protein
MVKKDFLATLATFTPCDSCGAMLSVAKWEVFPFVGGEWSAIGVTKCEPCSWMKVAAAGSSDGAHAFAQAIRAKSVQAMKK